MSQIPRDEVEKSISNHTLDEIESIFMGNLSLCKQKEYSQLVQNSAIEETCVWVVGSEGVGKDALIDALSVLGQQVGSPIEQSNQKIIYNGRSLIFRRLKKPSSESFQINIERCMRDSQVMLLCVDLSNTATMQSFSDHFFEKVLEYQRTRITSGIRLIIVGCQCDKIVRNHKEQQELSSKCRELKIPFFEVSSVVGTNIKSLLDSILSNEKNITQETVSEKISLLKNSRYLSMHSSLRDASVMSVQPSLARSKQQSVQGGGVQGNFEEESKFDSNSSQSNSRVLDQISQGTLQSNHSNNINNSQMYVRIIPYNKMYTKRSQLDKGNFGVVYKIELDGEECALKVCKIEMKEDTALNRFQIIFSEAENMQRFMLNRNMRIMPLKGISFQVDMLREHVFIGYWMPLCKYSLKHLLKNSFHQIDFKLKIRWSLQIIESLEVFDKEHIQHMDLKPQNILIDMNDDIVVSDLSMSKVFEEKQTEAFNMLGTTVKYAHPAAIVRHELSPRFDIYSFGVILLELFTGKQPWGDIRRDELKEIYSEILKNAEVMNPLRYHEENYPKEMKYITGKLQPIKDIIYQCCVAIFVQEKKDFVTINSIKMKFKELEECICGDAG